MRPAGTVALAASVVLILLLPPPGVPDRSAPGPVRVVPGAAAPLAVRPSAGSPWTSQTPPSGFPDRSSPGFAYDAADDVGLLFGGGSDAAYGGLNDTWEYSGGTWTNLTGTLTTAPSPRSLTVMSYDPVAGEFVLFGGFYRADAYNAHYLGDTWTFSAGAWTNVTTTAGTPPSPRFSPEMAWDPAVQASVLFGGVLGGINSAAYPQDDTWEFAGGTWTNVTTSVGTPPGRDQEALAWDGQDDGLLCYGGYNEATTTTLSDTWLFAGGIWTQLAPVHSPGTLRGASAAAYGGDVGQPFVVGGSDASSVTLVNRTWTFVDGDWQNLTGALGHGPSPRWGSGLVWDSYDEGILLVGGTTLTTTKHDVWILHWPVVINGSSINPASPESNQTIHLTLSAARGTGNYSYAWSGLPSGCASVDAPTVACAPTLPGNYTFLATVDDGVSAAAVGWNVTVYPGPTATLGIAPTLLTLGEPIAVTAAVGGGVSPRGPLMYTGLPPGCSSADVTAFNCTPTSAGQYSIAVTYTDAVGARSTSPPVGVQIVAAPTLALTSSRSPVDVGMPFTLNATLAGGASPVVLTWSGLPTGACTLGAANRSAACVATTAATWHVNVNGTDALGNRATSAATIDVAADPTLVIELSNRSGDAPLAVLFSAAVNGGVAPYALSWTFGDGSSGAGAAPEHTFGIGSFLVTATVDDALGVNATATATIDVGPTMTAALTAIPGTKVDVGQALALQATVAGGTPGFAYAWTGLPTGCASANVSTLTCSPTASGPFAPAVVVTDALDGSVRVELSLTVAPALALATTSSADAACAPETIVFTALPTGGVAPYSVGWRGPDGSSATSGTFSETFGAPGSFPVNVSVTDATGGRQNLTVEVAVLECGVNPGGPSAGVNLAEELALVGAAAVVLVGAGVVGLRRRRPPEPPEPEPGETPPD